MIKILYVTFGLEGGGGIERQLYELIRNLDKDKFEIHLVTMSPPSFYDDKIKEQVKSLNYVIRKKKFDFLSSYKIINLIRTINPDFIHSFDLMTSILSFLAAKFSFSEVIFINGSIRNAPTFFGIKDKISRSILNFSDVVIGNNIAGLKIFKQFGLENKFLIYNGFDFNRVPIISKSEARKKVGFESDIFYISMVAGIKKYKDHKTLLNAVRLVKNDKIIFNVVGDGENKGKLIELAEKFGIIKYLNFMGSRSDVEYILKASDVSVLCSAKFHGEGISNSILESLACGTPVIATDNGGTKEIIENNSNGFLIECGDAEKLAEKIEFLYKNKETLTKFAEAGKKTIKEKFSLENLVSNYSNLYINLYKKRKSS